VRVARAEDLVIYKIAAWRPQDQQDVERLVALHGERLDLERIRSFARELATMLEVPQRVGEVERVLARAMGTTDHKTAAVPAQAPAKRTPRRK
jgi:hypothetical protein